MTTEGIALSQLMVSRGNDVFWSNSPRARAGRAMLVLTALAGLVAGDGVGISSLLGVLMPHGAAAATGAITPYTPPSSPYVDPTPFLHKTGSVPTSALQPAPTSTIPTGYVDGRSQEVPSLRTAKARTFLNPDGTYTTRTYAAPVNWKDASGHWQTIDNTLVTRSDGRLHNTSGPLDVSLTPNAASGADVLAVQAGGASVGFGAPTGTASSAASVASSNAQYTSALPHADLHYSVSGGTVKEDIILHAAPGGGADAVYRFPLHANGVTPRQDPNGGVGLYDASGNEALVIPPGTMTDSYVDPHLGSGATAPVQVSLDQSGATPVVVVTASGTWLADPARVYPVTIDPSVSIGRNSWEGDDYVTNAYPNNYYAWQADDQIGYYNSSTGTNRTLLGYDITPIVGKRIISANWNGYFDWNYWISASSQYFIRPITAGWNLTATWNTQPPASATYIVDSAARNQWRSVDMTGWAVNWANGTWGFAGLRIDEGGYETNQTYWKKLAGDTSGNPSYIQVTYETIGAAYSTSVSQDDPPEVAGTNSFRDPGPNVATTMPITVKNTGSDAWNSGNGITYNLAYHVYDRSGNQLILDGQRTSVGYVPPGGQVTVNANVQGLGQGLYQLRWDVVEEGITWFSSSPYNVPTLNFNIAVLSQPVVQSPADQTSMVNLDRSTLSTATLTTNAVSGATQYRFELSPTPAFDTGLVTSGWQASTSWNVPIGALKDGNRYYWHVTTSADSGTQVTASSFSSPPRTFLVDSYQLGTRPDWPMDKVSVGGGGAASVNLATGNLVLDLPGTSLPTVTQPFSVGVTYNSDATQLGAYVDDLLPYGAQPVSMQWDSGRRFLGNASVVVPTAAQAHQDYFYGALQTYAVPTNGVMETYVYLDPANLPGEVMVQFHTAGGDWNHRAYWGPNLINYGGTNGTASLHQESASVPASGQWVRLTVPSSDVGIGGASIDGVAFSLYNGQAWFDHAGLAKPGLGLGYQLGEVGDIASAHVYAYDGAGNQLTSTTDATKWIARVEVRENDSTSWEFLNQAAPVSGGANQSPPQFQAPPGVTGSLTRDLDGTWTLTDPSGAVSVFDSTGVLTSANVDENQSGQAAFSYTFSSVDNSNNPIFPPRLKTVSDILGRQVQFAYDTTSGRLTSITTWDGRSLTFGYDGAARLTTVTYPTGRRFTLGYNDSAASGLMAGLVGSVTNPNNNVTTFAYGTGTGTGQTGPLDHLVSISQPTVGTTTPVTKYLYNTGSTDVQSPNCVATPSTSCPNGYSQRVFYDARNRLVETLQADQAPSATNGSGVAYDTNDRPLMTVDRAGLRTDTTYDNAGNVITSIGPAPDTSVAQVAGGVYAEYYSNAELKGVPSASGTSTGTGGALTFNWGTTGPDPSISGNPFSVRWTGLLQVPQAGTYTFTTGDSDGTRLRIGSGLAVDDWTAHGAVTSQSGSVWLPAGPARVSWEVFATSAPASAQLSWSGPGITGTQVIPTSSLTTEKWATSRSIYDGGLQGLKAAYYGNTSLSGRPTTLETDLTGAGTGLSTGASSFDINWNGAAPAAGVAATNWSARWSGLLVAPQSGTYHFLAGADDGVRLYVDGTLRVDNWPANGQAYTEVSSDVLSPGGFSLTAGTHQIMVEYQQLTGGSRVRVAWQTPGSGSYATIPAGALQPNYGLVTSTVGPAGTTTTASYTGGGQDPVRGLATDKTVVNKDVTGTLTTYTTHTTYDIYGRVLTTTAPKGMSGGSPDLNYTRTYHYDTGTGATAGLLLSEDIPVTTGPGSPGTGAITYQYETPQAGYSYSSGRVTQMVDQRGTWAYTVDADGRQISVTPPGRIAPSQATVTDYDQNGNVLDVWGPDGAVGMTYDALDRQTAMKTYASISTRAPQSTDTPDQVSSTLTFDAEGNALSADDGANGTGGVVTYGYDSLGRNTTITDAGQRQVTFSFDPTTGRLTDTNLPNGTKVHQDYDAAGRILNLTNTVTSSGAAIANYTNAQYTTSGQLTGLSAPDGQYAYTYDTLGRLETWTDPSGALHRYKFDLNSNRTEQDLNGTATHTYQYQGDATDRLTSVDSGTAYGYDSAGDVTSRPGQTLTWDPFGRISKVTNTADNSYVQYVYDSLHRVRERKQYNAAQTLISDVLYYFGGTSDQPSWEKETAGQNAGAVKSYLDGVAVEYAGNRSTGTPIYLYSDIHGNTVATADASGNRTAGPFTYDPFGVSTTPSGNGTNSTPFGFVGKFDKYNDAAAGGLVLMGARPYDPTLGRFLAVDPVEYGSANNYDYSNQDPVNGYDLTGDWPAFGNWRHSAEEIAKALENLKSPNPKVRAKAKKVIDQQKKATGNKKSRHSGNQKKPKQQPTAEPMPAPAPSPYNANPMTSVNPATLEIGVGIVGGGAILWWGAKTLAPACGPFALVCAFAF